MIKRIYLCLAIAVSLVLIFVPVYSGSFYCEGAAIPQKFTLVFNRVDYSLGYRQGIGQLHTLALIFGYLNIIILIGTAYLLFFSKSSRIKKLLIWLLFILSALYATLLFYAFYFGINDPFCKVHGYIHDAAFLSLFTPFLFLLYAQPESKPGGTVKES